MEPVGPVQLTSNRTAGVQIRPCLSGVRRQQPWTCRSAGFGPAVRAARELVATAGVMAVTRLAPRVSRWPGTQSRPAPAPLGGSARAGSATHRPPGPAPGRWGLVHPVVHPEERRPSKFLTQPAHFFSHPTLLPRHTASTLRSVRECCGKGGGIDRRGREVAEFTREVLTQTGGW